MTTNKHPSLLGECIAEFIGTGLLIFVRLSRVLADKLNGKRESQ